MNKLRDNDIREVLLCQLQRKHSNEKDVKIVNEMGVMHGTARVDVAVINGILHGYEIKSESDNLLRLPNQITEYSKVFERMTIVVQRKHLYDVRELVPKWWGITLVTKRKSNINLKMLRKGKVNPNIDPMALSSLLWRDEALEVLKERGLQRGYLSKPRKEIYKRISDTLSPEEIMCLVSERLKERQDWKCLEPQLLSDGLFQR